MHEEEKRLIEEAKTILRAKHKAAIEDVKLTEAAIGKNAEQLFELGESLSGFNRFDYARRMAGIVREVYPGYRRTKVLQKQALWTSKNPDQPNDISHDEALELLKEIQPLESSTDPESLGIAGGIWKRRWMIDGRYQSLETSLNLYERGAEQGIAKDYGYTAINAAFLHDLIASLTKNPPAEHPTAAKKHRERILQELPQLADTESWLEEERWFYETLAEAAFGLRDFPKAIEYIGKVAWHDEKKVKPWQFETFARQQAWLAYLLDPAANTAEQRALSEPWQALEKSFGDSMTAGLASIYSGKLGLALSGGGFRASFFHIGVLMYLAERHMLRHVEVLSCVSGGSILGAHYYLLLRQLLQTKTDAELERGDYTKLVEALAKQFLDGVQKNIRTRVILHPVATLKMMFKPGYTRTTRLAELYETHLYSKKKVNDDGRRRMQDLLIKPAGASDFRIHDNWRRSHKVPVLILNATAINTGHNWQFTASWMGEPPSSIDSKVDGNYRLRRLYYRDAPTEELKNITIGQAAAASSCVPGLFPPLLLRGLYDGIDVRLVDGGVHDNQGVFGLFDQDCSAILISDASGQMEADDTPKESGLSVLLRSSNISMSRVRTAQYRELVSRRESGRLKEFLFLHLKQDLESEDKDWNECPTPNDKEPIDPDSPTDYDVLVAHQRKLANIRTDLDSFTDTEAYALIASGYNMTKERFDQRIVGFETDDRPYPWKFVENIKYELARKDGPLGERLRIAKNAAFKVWHQVAALRWIAKSLGAALVVALLYVAWIWREEPYLSVEGLASVVGWAVVSFLGLGGVAKIVRYRKTLRQMATGVAFAVVGSVVAFIHIWTFDWLFLVLGRRNPRPKRDQILDPDTLPRTEKTNTKTG